MGFIVWLFDIKRQKHLL